MFSENPFIEPVDNWLTVWLGELDESELEEYLDEPGGVESNAPISVFGNDLGRWYDHDFIWMEGASEPISVNEICVLNGIDSQDLIDEIVKRSNSSTTKSLLILWNAKMINFEDKRNFAEGRLKCIGSWQHTSPLTD